MSILENVLGTILRPIRSNESKLVRSQPGVLGSVEKIEVTSPVFTNGSSIPPEFSVDGSGEFPQIEWGNVPENTKSIVLLVEDPDAPLAVPFIHAVVFNIGAERRFLPQGALVQNGLRADLNSSEIQTGRNGMGKTGYVPPSPPSMHGPHHYHFEVFALDSKLFFQSTPFNSDVRNAMVGHVLAFGELVGVYEKF